MWLSHISFPVSSIANPLLFPYLYNPDPLPCSPHTPHSSYLLSSFLLLSTSCVTSLAFNDLSLYLSHLTRLKSLLPKMFSWVILVLISCIIYEFQLHFRINKVLFGTVWHNVFIVVCFTSIPLLIQNKIHACKTCVQNSFYILYRI